MLRQLFKASQCFIVFVVQIQRRHKRLFLESLACSSRFPQQLCAVENSSMEWSLPCFQPPEPACWWRAGKVRSADVMRMCLAKRPEPFLSSLNDHV